MSELPHGWTTVRLGEVADFTSGGTPAKSRGEYWGGNVPWITSADIDANGAVSSRASVTPDGLAHSAAQRVAEGTTLLVTRTGVGKVAVAPYELSFSQDITAIVPSDRLDPEYLRAYLRSRAGYFDSNARGATIKGVTRAVVASLSVPLPPLPEQRRIAAILDKTIGLKEQAQIALGKATEVEWHLFRDTFGSPQSPRGGAYVMPFGELVKVKSGSFLPAHAMDPNGIYPVFGGNGANGFHNEYMFTEAQVVIGRVGAYCGAVHVTPSDAWVTDNALYVSETSVHCEPEFLALALRQANLNQHASKSGQPSISARRLANAQVLVAPVDAQHDFNRKRRAVTSSVEHHRVRTHHLSHLQDSLASRAFRGEL